MSRILITRSEIDLPQIKAAYQRMYGKDMLGAVRDDTSGDYRNGLVALLNKF
ncbi:MAG: hypothetical protein MJ252_15830 [archaeon]|nr:hypothetical protein [archaeon]